MEKREITIKTFNGTRKVTGYVFRWSGLRFAVLQNSQFIGAPKGWTITELKTGRDVNIFEKTRSDAVGALIKDSRLLRRIKEYIDVEYGSEDLNPDINPKNEFLTVMSGKKGELLLVD